MLEASIVVLRKLAIRLVGGLRNRDKTIAKLNVEHFRRLPATETDPEKRDIDHSLARRGRSQAARD
jgi:hypothetical protein